MDRYPIPHPTVLREILRQEKPFAPLTAMLHITEHCNVRCEFCWHHSYLRTEPRKISRMDTEDALKLIDELKGMGTTDITLSANGEPTIHPGFDAIVEAIRNKGMKLKVVTNLTHFSPKTAAALARAQQLIINFAAIDEKSYQAIYAPKSDLTFGRIVKNIKSISRLQEHDGPQIIIGHVITKNTYRYIAQALKQAELLGASSIRFKFIDPMDFTQSLVLNEDERQQLLKEIAELLKKSVAISHNLTDIQHELIPLKQKEASVQKGRCFIGWLVININENGSCTICCQNDQLIIGNWKKQSLKEIWEGPKAKEFREGTKTNIDFSNPLFEACKTCQYSNPDHYFRRVNESDSSLFSRRMPCTI